MANEINISQKKEWAQMLYIANELNQKQIADKVNVSTNTMSRWVTDGEWDKMRKSLLTTKKEVLATLYNLLDKMSRKLKEDDSVGDSKTADMFVKYTAAIGNLETDTSIAEISNVATKFTNYLQQFDPQFALSVVNHFDKFIKSLL